MLDAMATARTPIVTAYAAYIENRLDEYEARLRSGIADPDLEPYVAKWVKEMERRKRPNAHTRGKYERQVRTLIPAGAPFPRSAFTRQAIRSWLSGLDVSAPNRYRAALSSFAGFLLFEDVLQANPVRLVPMARESEPRTEHLSPADADALVSAMVQPYRALHALMIATGMELGAALSIRFADIKQDGVYARGTKREHRKRTCTVYGDWRAFWRRHVTPYLYSVNGLDAAEVFPGIKPWGAYRVMKAALAVPALKHLPQDYRVHDHRHTWAVQAVRDGLALHTIGAQLGHRDAAMVVKVYGRFKPTAADFDRSTTPKLEASDGL